MNCKDINQDRYLENICHKINQIQPDQAQQLNEFPAPTKKRMFFVPRLSIKKQIEDLNSLRKDELWNGQIVFLGFKGTLKPENWTIIEETLRSINGLSKLSFVDTQLDIERLVLLSSLIQLIQPKELSIKFKQNEIDDRGLEAFLNVGLMDYLEKKITTFVVVSNPGIFKGNFVKNIKVRLDKMSKTNQKYNFHFIKNKEYKSLGFIRQAKIIPIANKLKQQQELAENLKDSYQFDLSFKGCFQPKNNEAFYYLIEQSYHEEKLEQIESLDVGECQFQEDDNFQKMCQRISTSKGLLSLGFTEQRLFFSLKSGESIMKSLTGDRYEQLRLNHIDLRINHTHQRSEISVKVLANNLISKSIRTLYMESYPYNQNQYLNEISQAFMDQIKGLHLLMKNENKSIPKLSIKKIDAQAIFDVDTVRISQDEVVFFLTALVFNEFSICKEFIIQHLSTNNVLNGYLDALSNFEQKIQLMRKNNPLYVDFIPNLSKIEMHIQYHHQPINQILMEQFFRRVFFTQTTDLLDIKSINLHEDCLSNEINGLGFIKFLNSLNEVDQVHKTIKFSLQHLIMKQSGLNKSRTSENFQLLFKNVVFNNQFKVISLSFIREFIEDNDWIYFLQVGQIFLDQYTLRQQGTLQNLTLYNLVGNIDILKFVELLVFNEKIKLQELKVLRINVVYVEESMISLKQKANKQISQLSLKKLHLGSFKNELDEQGNFINNFLWDNSNAYDSQEYGEEYFQAYFKTQQKTEKNWNPVNENDLYNFDAMACEISSDAELQTFLILIEVLVLHPKGQVIELLLDSPRIQQNLTTIQNRIGIQSQEGLQKLEKLESLILVNFNGYTDEQWELIGDIFVYGKDTSITSIEFRGTAITSDLSNGLKRSFIKKQQYMMNIKKEKVVYLKTLKFDKCQFYDELFSLLLSNSQIGEQILHVKGCFGLEIAVEQFKSISQSPSDQLDRLSFSLCELIIDYSEIGSDELFEWFFRTMVFNTNIQKLKYLSLKSCELDDKKFIILVGLLQKFKNEYTVKRQKNYFTLRKFNFDGNPCISQVAWKSFFDMLFKIYDLSENDFEENEMFNLQKLELKSQKEEKLDLKDKMCVKTSQLIFDKRLLIPQKLIANPQLYKITPPLQLNRLHLDLQILDETDLQILDEVKQSLYDRILMSLVFFPGSQLKELSLRRFDIQMFLVSTEKCFECAAGINVRNPFSIQLKNLNLQFAYGENESSMQLLAELYIKKQIINLEVLIITLAKYGNFYQHLTDCIEQSLKEGKVCNLRLLQLNDVQSSLSVKQTLHFLKTVVFNKYVPLNILSLGQAYNCFEDVLELHSEESIFTQLYDHLIQQNYQCLLKEVTLRHNVITQNTLCHLLSIFIDGQLVKLDKFNIDESSNKIKDDERRDNQLLFVNLCDERDLINFTITDLKLCLSRKLTLEEFKFLYYVRPKLISLKLSRLSGTLDYPELLNQFLETQMQLKNNVVKSSCSLSVSFEEGKSFQIKQLVDKLVFGQRQLKRNIKIDEGESFNFYIEKISYNLDNQQDSNIVSHLQKLSIDFNLEFEEVEKGFKVIGDQLIYNENSIIKELQFEKDFIKIEELQILTSSAQTFRDRIEKCKQQYMTSLSLKNFRLNTSENIEVEGAEIIYKDILFFQYITIENINLIATKSNIDTSIIQCNYAQDWLQFQKTHQRRNLFLSIKKADWSHNNQVQSQVAWFKICDTFLFSNNTPLLEEINLSEMGIKDDQVKFICKKADDYFRSKSKNYLSPLKRLDIQKNTPLSPSGWSRISESFLFSKHVDLEELNLQGFESDLQENCSFIYPSAEIKAAQQETKKLDLHTLFCQNTYLKYKFALIMNTSQNDENNPYNLIEENPYSYGDLTSLFNISINQSNYVKHQQYDGYGKMPIFSEYHLDISSGLLRPLNEYLHNNYNYYLGDQFGDKLGEQLGHLPINIATCEELCTIFKYREGVGDPYPYQLLFSPNACEFYKLTSCKIRTINFIQTNTKNAQKVNQFQVFELWEQVKSSKTSLDKVFMEYQFDDDLVNIMMQKGYTERNVVNLVRLFPPSGLILRGSLSLQALKGIYSIMCDNYQLNYAQIIYDKDTSLNVGIGYSLRESVYKTNPTLSIARFFKTIMYHFFDLFVTPVSKFTFTKEIRQLNLKLSNEGNYLVMLTLLTVVYFVICIFSPYAWQHYYTPEVSQPDYTYGDSNPIDVCSRGITDIALYFYLVFAIFSFIAEALLYHEIKQIIPKHIQGLVQNEEVNYQPSSKEKESPQQIEQISPEQLPINNQEEKSLLSKNNQSSLVKKVNRVQTLKTYVTLQLKSLANSDSGRIFGHMIDLFFSQVAKLSLFTDVNFIMLTYYCDHKIISLLALISTGFNVSLQIYELIMFIVTHCFIQHKNKAKILSTKYINDFYEICVLGRNVALTTILDGVAPYNVSVIPNVSFIRALFPIFAGKSMSNSVRSYIVKFLFGDLPHIILQLYFVIYVAYHPRQNSDGIPDEVVISPLLVITILNTIRGVLFSFMRLMSIRPSTISQNDFDILIKQKSEELLDKQISFLKEEQKIIEALTSNIHDYP